MKENQTGILLNAYYRTISPLLQYIPCEKTDPLERQVLSLLCRVKGCGEAEEACWAMIDNAKCLQSALDGALLLSTDGESSCVAYDIKMELLTALQISKPRNFEEATFLENLQLLAGAGQKNACMLLACLNWLGLLLPENKQTALHIWSALAVSGDRLSMELLIYGHDSLGQPEEKEKWSHIARILQTEQENFSPIASALRYPDYAEQEVQLANIILFISQAGAAKLNRPMLHYVLHSKDDYATKMVRLSTETNYYLVMHTEDRFSQKEYGF